MGRLFSSQLDDPFAEVCLDDSITFFLEVGIKGNFLADHRFGFDDEFGLLLAENFFYLEDGLTGCRDLVNMSAGFFCLLTELLDEFGKLCDTLFPDGPSSFFVIFPGDFSRRPAELLMMVG